MAYLRTLFNDQADGARGKLRLLFVLVAAASVALWAWALAALHGHPALLASAVLAYTLGLRHALDADHIAAIDNVIRKLMQEGKRPVSAGLFFALGHSTVVVAMTLVACVAATALQTHLAGMKSVGGVVGTLVSASYLLLLGVFNLVILAGAWRAWRALRARRDGRQQCQYHHHHHATDTIDSIDTTPAASTGAGTGTGAGGPLARMLRPLFRIAKRSWHMYPIGLLFGLGFDTASEVALFGLAAAEASRGLSTWSILLFPALFTAAMALGDTTDGALMIRAYGWATTDPTRKLFYNLAITLLSVLAAFGIAGVELLGLLREEFHFGGPFWRIVDQSTAHFNMLGYAIVAMFIGSWLLSLAFHRLRLRTS